jgi:hypothetical protein
VRVFHFRSTDLFPDIPCFSNDLLLQSAAGKRSEIFIPPTLSRAMALCDGLIILLSQPCAGCVSVNVGIAPFIVRGTVEVLHGVCGSRKRVDGKRFIIVAQGFSPLLYLPSDICPKLALRIVYILAGVAQIVSSIVARIGAAEILEATHTLGSINLKPVQPPRHRPLENAVVNRLTPGSFFVYRIDGIIASIGIEIDLIVIPHRIGLHEAPKRRRIDPGLVMIHAQLTDPRLACIAEPAGIRGIGNAPGIVAVDRERIAIVVGEGHDRALMVRMVETMHRAPGQLV